MPVTSQDKTQLVGFAVALLNTHANTSACDGEIPAMLEAAARLVRQTFEAAIAPPPADDEDD